MEYGEKKENEGMSSDKSLIGNSEEIIELLDIKNTKNKDFQSSIPRPGGNLP